MVEKLIHVTQPTLPPLEEFVPYLQKIWASKVLTNGGPFHQQLEAALCEFLEVKHICLFANATIALVTALQSLRITGEVITTPYSFVATTHSLLWNGIKPVFNDICPHNLNLDHSKIESLITPQTTAIMPVHCYGDPCDVDAIQKIADEYNLKVIYDAAHAFGVKRGSESILNFGDLSILSFHATKVFNTFEGGAIICQDKKTKERIDHLKNFGIVNQVQVVAPGINGKMSEINAAFGMLQLQGYERAREKRRNIDRLYRQKLEGVRGLTCLFPANGCTPNYGYFPVLVGPQYPMGRDALFHKLADNHIHARRYFYPLISHFPMYRNLQSAADSHLPVAVKAANEILCLPIYPELLPAEVEKVANLLLL